MAQNEKKKSVSTADLKAMLAELQEKTESLQAENARLKQSMSRRPPDALNLGGVVAVFSKGSHKDLIGKTVKLHIPAEAIGSLYASCVVKETSNGNAFLTLRGWIDTGKLNLAGAVQAADSDVAKATKSFKDGVVNAD